MSFLGVEPGPSPAPPSIYQLDLRALRIGIIDYADGTRTVVRGAHDGKPELKTTGSSTREAWEKMWPMLVRERGGL